MMRTAPGPVFAKVLTLAASTIGFVVVQALSLVLCWSQALHSAEPVGTPGLHSVTPGVLNTFEQGADLCVVSESELTITYAEYLVL
jgi:hypothetical protein